MKCYACGDEIFNRRNAVIRGSQSVQTLIFCGSDCFCLFEGFQTDEEFEREDSKRLKLLGLSLEGAPKSVKPELKEKMKLDRLSKMLGVKR